MSNSEKQLWSDFTLYSSVFIVDSEQENASWMKVIIQDDNKAKGHERWLNASIQNVDNNLLLWLSTSMMKIAKASGRKSPCTTCLKSRKKNNKRKF